MTPVLEHQQIKFSVPQKDLLLWHWNLGVSIHRIKEFTRTRTFEEPNGNIPILTEIINPKFPAARNCPVPVCESCLLEIAKKCSTNPKKERPITEKEGDLSRDKIVLVYQIR